MVRDRTMDGTASESGAFARITLRQLQYFVAVAEEEHFTRAAERLTIAQPALSRQVSELEETLGVTLFVRGSRGVRLTEAGRELLERARSMLAELERTIHAVRLTAGAEFGRLRLGYYGPSFYNTAVTRTALELFRAESPDVEVIAREMLSEQVIRALRDDRIDVGISRGVVRYADIVSRVIATERAVVLLAADHEFAARATVGLADLDDRPLIVFSPDLSAGLNERLAEIASAANIRLTIAHEATQLATIAYHVARNDGIAILPESSARIPFPGTVTRQIDDPNATIDLTAVTRRGEESPFALRFLELLGARAGAGRTSTT
jgi:DNA-binding transcriptional LysR family regulator